MGSSPFHNLNQTVTHAHQLKTQLPHSAWLLNAAKKMTVTYHPTPCKARERDERGKFVILQLNHTKSSHNARDY